MNCHTDLSFDALKAAVHQVYSRLYHMCKASSFLNMYCRVASHYT
jgi:hypothetical protein